MYPKAWKNVQLTCYFSTPMQVGKYLYTVTGELSFTPTSKLHCVDLATGKPTWTKDRQTFVDVSIMAQDRGSAQQTIRAAWFNPENVKKRTNFTSNRGQKGPTNNTPAAPINPFTGTALP